MIIVTNVLINYIKYLHHNINEYKNDYNFNL